MNLENPNFELENQSEKNEQVQILFNLYIKFYEALFSKNKVEKLKSNAYLVQIHQVEDGSFRLDPQIILEAKKQALSVPDSMFLSDKAFDYTQKSWAKYQFINANFKELPAEIREGILKIPNTRIPDHWNVKLIVAMDGDQVAGYTRFWINFGNVIEVEYQRGKIEYPGVGLGMLNYLISTIAQKDIEEIYLSTMRNPAGLGNLGFEFDEDRSLDLNSVFYKYESEIE